MLYFHIIEKLYTSFTIRLLCDVFISVEFKTENPFSW